MREPGSAPSTWEAGLRELRPNVYAYVQAGGGFCVANAGLIVGDDGCVVIDTLFTPSMTRGLQAAIRDVTDAPVRLVINTHHHVDHTVGNTLFPEATIVSQANARRHFQNADAVKQRVGEMAPHFREEIDASGSVRAPNLTFQRDLALFINNEPVHLYHFGMGHTEDDVIVHLPQQDLVFAGDLAFHYVTPLAHEGDIAHWTEVSRMVADLGPVTLVPGHGPVGDLGDFAWTRAYLERVWEHASRNHDAGRTLEEAARSFDFGPFATWAESERLIPNLMRCYQALDGDLDGPLDPSWPERMARWMSER